MSFSDFERGSLLVAYFAQCDPMTGHTVQHVKPCRQHPWVVAVDETIVPCSEHGWLSILCHKGCLRLQGLGVAKPTLLLAIASAQAVGS